MVERWDKILYDSFIDGHPICWEIDDDNREFVYETIDWLYHDRPGEAKFHKALDEVNAAKLQKKLCAGNAFKSVNTAYQIILASSRQKKSNDFNSLDEDSAKYKSIVQNMYSAPAFQEAIKRDNESENVIDSFIYGQSIDSQYANAATQEDADFRQWLFNRMRGSKDIRQIMELFGRFYKLANVLKRQEYRPSSVNVSGAELGNEIEEVFDDELLGLVAPELANLFYHNYAQEELMQYEYREKVETGKGNIQLMLDISGSMELVLGETKAINVALGFALCLVRSLQDDNRHVTCYLFNDSCTKLFDTREQTMEECTKLILSVGIAGGTQLQRAFEKVCEESEDDIIMVTDAMDAFLDTHYMNEVKGERRFSCLLVSQYQAASLPLARVADSFIVANSEEGFDHLVADII